MLGGNQSISSCSPAKDRHYTRGSNENRFYFEKLSKLQRICRSLVQMYKNLQKSLFQWSFQVSNITFRICHPQVEGKNEFFWVKTEKFNSYLLLCKLL